jgi:hypothetical protein
VNPHAIKLPASTIPNSNDWFVPKTPQTVVGETADAQPSQSSVETDGDCEVGPLLDTPELPETSDAEYAETVTREQRAEAERVERHKAREFGRKIIAAAEKVCRQFPRGTQHEAYAAVFEALVKAQPVPAFWTCSLCGLQHDETADPTLACPTKEPKATGNTPTTFEQRRRAESGILAFKYPKVQGGAYDFVVGAATGAPEGWFPRGDVHLVGGPSGSNKTTFMIDVLESQLKGEKFLGHPTFKLPYLVLMSDRGQFAHLRTANRMRFDPDLIPIKFLPSVTGVAAAKAILKEIENSAVLPAVVFVEGCDLLMENASKMEMVVPFLDAVQRIAAHYHISIIGSVGSPKTRQGEGYVSKRDGIFGTVAWSRKTETIAVLQYPGGDDMDVRRTLSVLLRNGPAEKYNMKLENGRLVEAPADAAPSKQPQIEWFKSQTDWFTSLDLQQGLGISQPTADRYIKSAHSRGVLKMKPGPTGGARLYKWYSGQAGRTPDSSADIPEVGI